MSISMAAGLMSSTSVLPTPAGDTVVFLRKHNAVHFGEVFNNAGYPYIDVDNGGHIDGMILFCERMLVELNDDATVIPGHGPVVGVMELRNYIAMLKKVRTIISALVLACINTG